MNYVRDMGDRKKGHHGYGRITHCLFSHLMAHRFMACPAKHFLDLTSQFQYRSDIIGRVLYLIMKYCTTHSEQESQLDINTVLE